MAKLLAEAFELLMTLVMLISGSIGGINAKTQVPDAKPVSEILSLDDAIFGDIPVADTVYVVTTAGLSSDERNTLTCLQGIVNREKAQLFIPRTGLDNDYLALAEEEYGFSLSRTDANGDKWSPWSILELFKGCLNDSGAVLYNRGSDDNGFNMAFVIAAAENWLAVTPAQREKAEAAGLTVKRDISSEEYNLSYVKRIFKEYKDVLNTKLVIHLEPGVSGVRELAVQQKAFIFYTDESSAARSFRRSVFKWADDNAPVLGWASGEKGFVYDASGEGCFVIPADHSYNYSFYSAFDTPVLSQMSKFSLYTDGTKHYVALVMSDGDNSQYIQNGFSEFCEKTSRADCDFPMTWTFAPLQQCVSPFSAEYMYSRATANDSFISGCSGAGYIELTDYPIEALGGFSDLTAAAMYKSGMSIVTVLNNLPEEREEEDFVQRLRYFARYDNIKGGILELDPDRYCSGQGKVYFADDKPLSIESLRYFVSCLDEDVVLLSAEELVNMIEANVPHVNAMP